MHFPYGINGIMDKFAWCYAIVECKDWIAFAYFDVVQQCFCIYCYLVGELKRQTVSLLRYLLLASRAVNWQIYFRTRLLQCPIDVPQCLMFLTLNFTVDLLHGWTTTHFMFYVSAYYEAFLRITAVICAERFLRLDTCVEIVELIDGQFGLVNYIVYRSNSWCSILSCTLLDTVFAKMIRSG